MENARIAERGFTGFGNRALFNRLHKPAEFFGGEIVEIKAAGFEFGFNFSDELCDIFVAFSGAHQHFKIFAFCDADMSVFSIKSDAEQTDDFFLIRVWHFF